jgi:hypothetical protein
MKIRLFPASVLAAGIAVGATAAGVSASSSSGLARHDFRGHLLATPGSSSSLRVHVEGGNRLALRKMLGQTQDQSFAVGPNTEYLRWEKGVPTVVHESDLAAGDVVVVHVRAQRSASLAEVEATAAGVVADRGPNPGHPNRPLFLFRGKLTAVGSNSVTVDIRGGNHRALRLLIGQPATETFAFDQNTEFLLWKGRLPSVITPSMLTVGDRATVRVRAAPGSNLSGIASTPAARIAEHEPAAQ